MIGVVGGAPVVNYRFETTPSSHGAIGVVAVSGDVDALLRELGLRPIGVGEARTRTIPGVDTLLIARWTPSSVHFFPHGGQAVARALEERLRQIGATTGEAEPRVEWPESRTEIEALMLATLAEAASPLAVDLLLAQPARWAAWIAAPSDRRATPDEIRAHSAALDRLVHPPVVAAIGASNIGKSSLLNALARREASLVADEPGTTRDYVGTTLDLGGLVVRWLDCPGVRSGANEIERRARAAAEAAARGADLVVSCADAEQDWLPELPGVGVVRIATRADLGTRPGAALNVSAARGSGLDELAALIRERLAPTSALGFEGPWLFHPRLTATPAFA